MNSEYINPVLRSMTNVMNMMVQIDAKASDPTVKTDNLAQGDVTGIIEVTGKNFKGSMSLTFSKSLLLELTRRMLRLETQEINDAVKDLAGEMTNMVIGGAKSEMDDNGYPSDMSTPRIVNGTHHSIVHNIDAPTVIIPYQTEIGDMYVELCFEENDKDKD